MKKPIHATYNFVVYTFGLLILFIVFLSKSGYASDLNEKPSLFLETTVSVPVIFAEDGPNPSLQYLIINYSWIPKSDYRQKLISAESSPEGSINNNALEIKYTKLEDFDLEIKFNTFTSSQRVVVNDKIMFPLKGLNSSLGKYTSPSEKIDINDDIKKQAEKLAAGEDDLYVVVFKLADWVNSNIAYNLSSATSEATLPSSWVLANKYGVCDELSNLFISMCRSLGIPARFVSGIAYSDDPQFENEWGAHGWVEVYFPKYGWIPFDPKYNQLGYVDATHIKFDDQREGAKDALTYTWLGKNIDISSGKMGINAEVVNEGTVKYDDFSIDVGFMKKDVAFNSYNVVKAVVKNNMNYYVAASLTLARTEGIETISKESQDILLLPKEEKMVYWIVKVDELNRNYVYTFPMSVYSYDKETTEEFKASSNGQRISLKAAQDFISESKVSLEGPAFVCNSSKSTVYVNDTITIRCSTDYDGYWTFCIDDKCAADKFINVSRNITLKEVGFTTVKLTLSNAFGGTQSYEFLGFNVLDEANVSMGISSSEKLMFNERGSINVSIEKESSNIPVDARLIIENSLFSQEWKFESIEERKNFELGFEGKSLKNGINEFNVTLEFKDELGRDYRINKSAYVELYNLTFFQKIYVWFNGVLISVQ